jgi:hypothetical protein
MNFLDLNDDVKFIISKHLQSDCEIRTMFSSKHHDLQKILYQLFNFFYISIHQHYYKGKFQLIQFYN